MSNLGDRVKALRESTRESQTDLANSIGLSYGSISNIERTSKASSETIDLLCKHFKVEKAWLVTGEGEAPKGVIVPLKPQAETPWRDETLAFLKAENQRLWKLVEKLSGAPAGSIANFSSAVGKAGKQISLLPTVKAA